MSATALALSPGDWVPGTRYQIVRPIGAGGMGVVYQVVKPPNIGGVLKLMSTELAALDEQRTRFFDEVRILAQLDHPNIVKVFDYDALPDGSPFYVMELLHGRTVRDVIYTMGRVPPRVAYEITRQLLEALQCAHTHEVPVIHRDIKPENIFLHAPKHGEPVVKLIDFGVSAVADRKHDGGFVGTWSYAAPEQIRGEAPTPTTDLYAAGLVLYEMLAGVGPFDHFTDWAQVSAAQLRDIPAPVSKFAPWVPPSIVALIASVLEKDPRRRPRDAYAFAEQLFELEWASDGKDPNDATVHGPSLPPPTPPIPLGVPVGTPAAGPRRTPVRPNNPGVIAFALSTVVGANPSSKNMAAASPAADRLADIPLIGVPAESVRKGPTEHGIGDIRHEMTSPDADALLDGLGAAPRRSPSRRERESGPDLVEGTPRPGQFIIRAGGHPPQANDGHSATTPRAMPVARNTAVTLDAEPTHSPLPARAIPARDTFSSQQSDTATIARARTRVGITALVSAAVVLLVVALIAVAVRVRTHPAAPPPTANATTANATTTTVPEPSPPISLSTTLPASVTAPTLSALVKRADGQLATSSKPASSPSLANPVARAARTSPSSSSSRATAPSAVAPAVSADGDFIRRF